ncbi:Retrovirus-related Pol polyprotein from transposon TNT 1-94 [Senna tora]|uniref:Retrovirus-related Pol polyprotein from transposon TNT 1-94 n=1 Tax=Senna tora TaxID=362788 RepID=A0A834SKM0_9FABA|nr:Retrovirus-related Pol polyprotein from transposon TNT 1-94 [Senna tora]
MKLTSIKGVREHIMRMRDITAQLKTLEVELPDSFLVYSILNSLPPQYGPFKISYNTHKQNWSINEEMTMCVQEEGRLLAEMGESAHLANQGKDKNQAKKKGKGKASIQGGIKNESKCFFCKKKGHMKKDCMKFKAWLDKKGFSKPKEANKQLGHISLERVKRLVKEEVLNALDFTDFNICIDCIKGKQTNKTKKGAKRSSSLLEIIHTDICSPDMGSSNQKYFITFIDDYSRYMFLYLLNNKNETLDAFKVFKAEEEKQCDKQIKIVRSEISGEYYGRYTEDGQAPGPFASGSDQTWNLDSENDHIETRTPSSSDRLVIINAPQVQRGIEEPIIEEPQSIDHDLVDPVVQQPQEPVIQPNLI